MCRENSLQGQLLKQLCNKIDSNEQLDDLFSEALKQRNRLAHSFYRQHNFKRNTDEGRDIMIQHIGTIHDVFIEAYKAALLISGIDIEKMINTGSEGS